MNGLVKVLTGILGVLAVIACLATVGVIIYTMTGAGGSNNNSQETLEEVIIQPEGEQVPDGVLTDGSSDLTVEKDDSHVHAYSESVDVKATCYQAGRMKYTCSCGDYYFADVLSTGHVPDEWEHVRNATKDEDGLKIKRCIYCDEIVAKEIILFEPEEEAGGETAPHIHQYTASVAREATCILAGLRKFTCSCGSFYTEKISAPGHVATDWVTVEEPTTKYMGRAQRTCTVCGVILDSRPINALKEKPTASPGATPGTGATATPSPTPKPTATPTPAATPTASPSSSPSKEEHSHNYTSYVLKEPNCAEKGIRSFICNCGSSYAESIELDPNRHSFRMTNIPATDTTPGYTLYTCTRCNYSTQDNYTTN